MFSLGALPKRRLTSCCTGTPQVGRLSCQGCLRPVSLLVKHPATAYALVAECDCEAGCPRCLHSTDCPQHNEALNKDLGLFLLDAISQAAENT
ncbi:hypothetical protein [Nostoc sp.]|uniref:hypothetical protein n=1 Tax=Nostoc sp. TaxID=1180 RepID=UPI002FF65267